MPKGNALPTNVPNEVKIDYMRQYQSQKRACEEANGALRAILKQAKSYGLNTKSLIGAVSAIKLDPDTVRNDLRDQIDYMRLLRMPIAQRDLFPQLELFGEQEPEEVAASPAVRAADAAWDADDQGYTAGRLGAAIEVCPYEPGSELALHWITSWRQGQASIAKEMGPDQTLAPVSRERPARDPAAETAVETVASITETVARKRGRPRKATNGSGKTASQSAPSPAH